MKKVKQIINNIHSSSAVVSESDLQKVLDYYINNQISEQINTMITVSSSLNYGNTYYISTTMGDDVSGVKGNPQKPYATFAAVAALYQDNEIIYILDGNITATGITVLNTIANIKIFIDIHATLTNFIYTPLVNNHKVTISGGGTLYSGGYYPTPSYSGEYFCNVDNFEYHNVFVKSGRCIINCKSAKFSSSGNIQVGDTVAGNTFKKEIILNSDFIKNENSAWWPNQYAENSMLSIICNTLESDLASSAVINGTYNGRLDGYKFNFSCKNLLTPNAGEGAAISYWASDKSPFNDVDINIHIGSYKGNCSLFNDYGPGSSLGTNCKYRISSDYYHCTRTTFSLLKEHSISELGSPYLFEIDGFFISDNVPLLTLTTTMLSKYKFTGTFITKAAVPAFNLTSINASARLNLENAKFIVASGQKVIEATGASDVYCMNVVTNSTTTDAEVTEVGQAIVRNANFV